MAVIGRPRARGLGVVHGDCLSSVMGTIVRAGNSTFNVARRVGSVLQYEPELQRRGCL